MGKEEKSKAKKADAKSPKGTRKAIKKAVHKGLVASQSMQVMEEKDPRKAAKRILSSLPKKAAIKEKELIEATKHLMAAKKHKNKAKHTRVASKHGMLDNQMTSSRSQLEGTRTRRSNINKLKTSNKEYNKKAQKRRK